MESLHNRSAATPAIGSLIAFAEQAAAALYSDDRVRALWLTGSLVAGTADSQSDVDLRAAIRPDDFARIGECWQTFIERISPTVWKRRWPGPPDQAITSAITPDYMRFDLVIQSAADTRPRTLEAARVLFDKDGQAGPMLTIAPAQHNASAQLPYIVEEFIRLFGMLTIVVGRDDVPIGMEGQLACHSLFISLLLIENGLDRMAMGKRHVAAFLNDEQRAVLISLPPLAPAMDSIVHGRVAYARLFLPRARRLMEANGLAYPEAFEAATLRHLKDKLGIEV